MDTYSSDTSYIIRHDFLRFNTDVNTTNDGKKKKTTPRKHFEGPLEIVRSEMTNDNGQGSLGRYKCPIF